jgi:hypothetical protein
MKKLYVVKITFQAYALGNSVKEAIEYADQIQREVYDPEIDAYETDGNELGWDPRCLVYHAGEEDLELCHVLPEIARS